MTTTRMTITTRVTIVWDLIEARSFCEDIKDFSNNNDGDGDDDDDNENSDEKKKNNNENEGISALARHGDLGFSGGYKKHQGLCR